MGPRSPQRQRTTSSTMLSSDRKRVTTDPPLKTIIRSRVAALVPKLKCLEPTQDMAAHQALVRHLQFSPDGKFMATSRYFFFKSVHVQCLTGLRSWDRTSVIFRVQVNVTIEVSVVLLTSFVECYSLTSPHIGSCKGICWTGCLVSEWLLVFSLYLSLGPIRSPTGHLLLTKLNRGVKVWTQVSHRQLFTAMVISFAEWLLPRAGRCLPADYRPSSLCRVNYLGSWW